MSKRIIGIVGGRLESTTPEAMLVAERAGRELALRGAAIICGGEDGIMEAVCKGCREAGGVTIGVMKGKDRKLANRYVDHPILTSMDLARNNIIVWSAEGILAFDGMYGTLAEIALALDIGKPLISVGQQRLLCLENVSVRCYAHYEGYDLEQVPEIIDHLFRMIGEQEP